jgi:serine phosphatase RsbU (regulator of sigma subunit)
MRLRAQLVLALFLLAVVPLMAATVYAYWTSERALRGVLAAEAGALAESMGGRMDDLADQLSRRIAKMRARSARSSSVAYTQARETALLAAQQAETKEIVRGVLEETPRQKGEVPFAVDDKGQLFTADPAELARLSPLALPLLARSPDPGPWSRGDFVIAARQDRGSGLTFGIARPMGEAFQEIRRTAVRNLGLGLAFVGLATLGILPVSRRMTRDLVALESGALRLAQGHLDTRVAVRSRNEIGRLGETFNRMASELHASQERMLAQERMRKELEMCRRLQVELLPRGPLETPFGHVTGMSLPAREVGGDFFNYFVLPAGEVALVVGDVSGKGLAAAFLMANVQATLRGSIPLAWDLAQLATKLDLDLHAATPAESYLTLFAGILDDDLVLRYVNAGHNPPLLVRSDGTDAQLEATGRPLGLLPGGGYEEGRVALSRGDILFVFTDGLVDLEDERGEALGTESLVRKLKTELRQGVPGLIGRAEAALLQYRGAAEPPDDATLVVLELRDHGPGE